METPQWVWQFCWNLYESGYRGLIVGGAVRDYFLGKEAKDWDIEVYGPESADELLDWLVKWGYCVNAVGKSFGVFKVKGSSYDLDVSLPRRDSKVAEGHKGFVVQSDGTMTPVEAAARRDYTMNAIGYDPLNNEVIDPYNGVYDIYALTLRATSDQFSEDPLRVLRGFQFAGRFRMTVDRDTAEMCKDLLVEYFALSKDRVWGEWWKWATKSVRPSAGLDFLAATGWASLYPRLTEMMFTRQDTEWHPEGGVWKHTKISCDKAARIAQREQMSTEDRGVLVLAALLHDIGKPAVTRIEDDGRITSAGHAAIGSRYAESFLTSIGAPLRIKERVCKLVATHMRHVGLCGRSIERATRRLLVVLDGEPIEMWAAIVEVDHSARPPLPGGLPETAARMRDYALTHEPPVEPLLQGRDLIALGWTPGPHFGRAIRASLEAQIEEGLDRVGVLEWAAINQDERVWK